MSAVRENYAMFKSSQKLAALFKNGLIPKTRQEFELALASYAAGKSEAAAAAGKLKSLLDYEREYANALVEEAKAKARLSRLIGQGVPAAALAKENLPQPASEAARP